MRWHSYLISVLVLLMVSLMACAPKATPAPAIAPAPAPPAPAPAPAAAPTPSPQEAAWAQVVSAARKEGMVVTYTAEMVGDMGAAVAEAFKKATGIKLEILAIGSAARAERIRSEARAGIYIADISDGSAAFQAVLKVDKLTQALGDLPVFFEKGVWTLDPQKVDPARHIVYYSPSIQSIWVNTKLVKPEDEPKSWYDLLDPKWKGKKIGVAHPTSSSLSYWAYGVLTRQAGFKDDYFQKLGQQDLKFVPGAVWDQMSALARGETYVAWPGSMTHGLLLVKEGAPVKPLPPKEGSVGTGLSMSLLANAPHPNATRVFINWILGQEGQTVFHRARVSPSMRKDVSDFSPPAGRANYDPLLVADDKDVEFVESTFRQQVLTKMWIK